MVKQIKNKVINCGEVAIIKMQTAPAQLQAFFAGRQKPAWLLLEVLFA